MAPTSVSRTTVTTMPSAGRKVTVRLVEAMPLRARLNFKRTLSKGVVSGGGGSDWMGGPVLFRLESTDGVSGFGQVRPPIPWLGETTESIVAAVRHCYGPALIGVDALERQEIAADLERVLPGNSVARAGLEIALHDLLGRTLGVPVHALLGGAARSIPLDWSISLNPTEAMVAEAVRAVQEFGVTILCVKMGPSSRWEEDVATFRQIRAAVGPKVEIGIDPNEGYDLATCLRTLRCLDSERVAYVEQPLHRDDLEGQKALRQQGLAPLLIDESATHLAEVQRQVTEGACDGIVLKLWKSGGFAGALRMATLAEAAGLRTTIGGVAQGSVLEAAACAHLAVSTAAPPMGAEFVLGLNVVDTDPIAALPPSFVPRDGHVMPPPGPGLGIAVDLEAARAIALDTITVDSK